MQRRRPEPHVEQHAEAGGDQSLPLQQAQGAGQLVPGELEQQRHGQHQRHGEQPQRVQRTGEAGRVHPRAATARSPAARSGGGRASSPSRRGRPRTPPPRANDGPAWRGRWRSRRRRRSRPACVAPHAGRGISPPQRRAQRGTAEAARMRRFLSILFGDDAASGERQGGYADEQIAAAALMVEAARLDGSFTDVERDRIRKLLVQHFQLNPWAAGELLARAERTATESVAWQGFTQAIKDALPPEERVGILEMLWEVAYADGKLHDYEASLLRRVAGLLYVSDRDSGEARLRVMERLGIAR